MSYKHIYIILFALMFCNIVEAQDKTYKLIVFEGSDWCTNCIRLEKKILSQQLFEDFALNNNLIIERIDFPQREAQDKAVQHYNATMAERYNFKGVFPTILLVDDASKIVSDIPYQNQDVSSFTELVSSKIPIN